MSESSRPVAAPLPPLARRAYCNRTHNLRGIRAVGCDMDYTLVHYNHDLWEETGVSRRCKRLCARWSPGHYSLN